MSLYKIELSDTYDLIDKNKMYDLNRCIDFILERGKTIFGYHFTISPKQRTIYYHLLAYAIGDPKKTAEFQLNMNKGLLIHGRPEMGKTAIMRLIQYFFSSQKQYELKPIQLLAQDFSCRGYDIFTPIFAPNAKGICLDNLGRETTMKYYGTSCDIAYHIVEHFYERRFDLTYPKLHIITELSASELEAKYGQHFRKMLREMFNVILCEQ